MNITPWRPMGNLSTVRRIPNPGIKRRREIRFPGDPCQLSGHHRRCGRYSCLRSELLQPAGLSGHFLVCFSKCKFSKIFGLKFTTTPINKILVYSNLWVYTAVQSNTPFCWDAALSRWVLPNFWTNPGKNLPKDAFLKKVSPRSGLLYFMK